VGAAGEDDLAGVIDHERFQQDGALRLPRRLTPDETDDLRPPGPESPPENVEKQADHALDIGEGPAGDSGAFVSSRRGGTAS
jgi:hypothetical protein